MEPSLRTWVRNFARLATVCGMVTLVSLNMGGCPIVPPACTDAASCDDTDACTTDVCTAGICSNTAIAGCCADETDCDDSNACSEYTCTANVCANSDPSCDDGLFCNGDENCDAATGCVDGTAPCDVDDEVCLEETGECVPVCDTVADCTDTGLFCETVACTDGACITGPRDCDDGIFCNGEDTCNEDTDACDNAGDPCAGTDTPNCDEANGECIEGVACDADADCDDDGQFCNGAERCGGDGFCESAGSPCTVTQTCNEDINSCENPPGTIISLTLGPDGPPLTNGTGGDDTYSAPTLFNAGTGTLIASLQNGDSANGGDGNDVLNATFTENSAAAGNQTVAPTLTGIETVNLTDFGVPGGQMTTFSAVSSTGITAINNVNSTDDAVTVNNLNSLVNLGITNSTSDLTVTLVSPGTNSNTDAITLTLSGARSTGTGAGLGSTVTLNTPANGIETLTVASNGSANILDAFNHAATTLLTANITGAQDLTIFGALPATLTTLNANGASGTTKLLVGGAGAGANVTFTGGTGNDTINFAGTYTAADTINGGTGTNTLGLNSAQAALAITAQSNVTNIQTVQIVDPLGANVDVTRFGATDAVLDTTAAATALTGAAATVTLGSGNRTFTLNNDDTAHALTVTVTGVGTSDTLAFNQQNADLGAALTINGAETVNLASGNGADGTAADGNSTTATAVTVTPSVGASTLNLTGSVSVTVTGVITAGTVNAGGLGAAFIHETTSGTLGAGGSVIGSAFNDELVGSAANDSISGGDGNDQIKGFAHTTGDFLTGGNGVDRFFYDALGEFTLANPDTVIDFTAGTDKIGLGTAILDFAGVVGTEAAPVALTTANFETARNAVASIAAGDNLKIVRISGDQTTVLLQTATGGVANAYVLAFDSTLGRGVLYYDNDWSTQPAGRVIVARFENITTNAGVQALTFTDFEEID